MLRQVESRDRLDDINHSGPAPEFIAWVDEVQLPGLARRPEYSQQFLARIAELEMLLANLEQQVAGGRLDLEPAAGIHRRALQQLTALVEGPA